MDHERSGYSTSSEALQYYVDRIVDPAVRNLDEVASKLFASSGLSYRQLIGRPQLAGGAEFTGSCTRMLDEFFSVHGALVERQQALLQTVRKFRENLLTSDAMYHRTENAATQSLTSLSRRLEGDPPINGTT
ncbi:hypothetical protein [Actinokineospora diospyrosa]|uniref:Excreted virulence factor EspC (Type VII ESX diderm) n=1 Tax=Actinokineospora diospyrosa TaxID=103728 RepID=A0ABT1IAQ9_9PSEU|nr:hypothetical protein [Actinokineospora diospyrosa]MCP2269720.1 hypothetical protein [Actinokineospora diospyrosa]